MNLERLGITMDLISCRYCEEELKKVTKVAEILSGKDNNKFPWSFEQGLFYDREGFDNQPCHFKRMRYMILLPVEQWIPLHDAVNFYT